MDYAWVGWLSSGLVGLGGLFVAWKAGDRQQRTALAVAEKQIEGQREAADRERRQRLLEVSYLELLRDLAGVYQWAYRVYPRRTMTAEKWTMPPVPNLPGSSRTDAVLTAYWSATVRALMGEWRKAVLKIVVAGLVITRDREDPVDDSAWGGLRPPPVDAEQAEQERRLNEVLRPAILAADEAVRAQIRRELLED